MVLLFTKGSFGHGVKQKIKCTQRRGFGDKESINNLRLSLKRNKISAKRSQNYTEVPGKTSNNGRSNCFLKVTTAGKMAGHAGNLFTYFTTHTENVLLLGRRRLGPYSIL